MAAKKENPAMDHIVDMLKKNRGVSYAEIKEAAAKKKLDVYPIMYGRAQALLGIVKAKPRGQGKVAKAKAAAAAPAVAAAPAAAPMFGVPIKRGPGRPRKNPLPTFDGSSLEGIVAAVKGSEAARARYRTALEKIAAILTDALS